MNAKQETALEFYEPKGWKFFREESGNVIIVFDDMEPLWGRIDPNGCVATGIESPIGDPPSVERVMNYIRSKRTAEIVQPDKESLRSIRDIPLREGDWAVDCFNPGHFLKVHPNVFGQLASNGNYSYYRPREFFTLEEKIHAVRLAAGNNQMTIELCGWLAEICDWLVGSEANLAVATEALEGCRASGDELSNLLNDGELDIRSIGLAVTRIRRSSQEALRQIKPN